MSRSEFLARVSRALARRGGGAAGRRAVAEARVSSPVVHALPAIAQYDAKRVPGRFRACLESQGAHIEELVSREGAPEITAALIARLELSPEIMVAPDRRLADVQWEQAHLRLCSGAPHECRVMVAHAVCGVAETGTVVLASGAESPALFAFLPDLFVVLLSQEEIVPCYEAAVRLVGQRHKALPRAVSLVSGPSRTGDIGGRIVMGAHGPRTLAVLIY